MTTVRSTLLRALLAVLLAFALWVFVSYTRNPDRTSSFDSVPVEIEGLDPGLIVVDQEGLPRSQRQEVDVTVDGDEATLQNVRPSDLRVFVDLTGRGVGEHTVPVNVTTTRSARLRASADPDFMLIRLDAAISRTVPLTVELSGAVPFGFEAGAPQLRANGQPVETVLVRGPAARVDRVVGARVRADITGLTANLNSPRPVDPIDADNRVVAGVTVEPASVDLQVPIVSSVGIKRVPVLPEIVGQPASGFVVAAVQVAPLQVTLTGSSGPLDTTDSVSTEPVDLAGASRTFSRTVALIEPLNTRLRFGEPTTAVVTVEIAPIARPFQVTLPVPIQVTGVADGLLVSLSPAVVQVQLSGTTEQLEAIGGQTPLVGTVSARGLSEGVYELEPALALPAGVTLAQPVPRVTVTLRAPATVTPNATGAATPEPQDGTPTPAPTGTPAPTP